MSRTGELFRRGYGNRGRKALKKKGLAAAALGIGLISWVVLRPVVIEEVDVEVTKNSLGIGLISWVVLRHGKGGLQASTSGQLGIGLISWVVLRRWNPWNRHSTSTNSELA